MKKAGYSVTLIGERPKIDPALVPECDYERACRVLNVSVRRALADPKRRAEFEEWKRKRAEGEPET